MEGDNDIVVVNEDETFIKFESNDLCRLCVNSDNNQMIPIYSGEGLELEIANKIKQYLPNVKITDTDKLPSNVCVNCASMLINWHNFYEECGTAERNLNEIISAELKLYQDDDSIEYVNEMTEQETMDGVDDTCENSTEIVRLDFVSTDDAEIDKNTEKPTDSDNLFLDELRMDCDDTSADGIKSTRCSICNQDFVEGQIINNQFVCEICCYVKTEPEWNDARSIDEESEQMTNEIDQEDANLPEEKYQCALCDKILLSKKSMIKHVNDHTKKTFACNVCHSSFRTMLQLKKHQKWHVRKSSSTLIYCEFCKKYFKTKKGFAYHQQKICIQYKCYICDEKFLVNSVLLDHMKNVHDVKDNKISTSSTTANNDNETVMSACSVCGKVVTQAVLPRHMLLHSKDKPFACDLCGKQFKRKNSLKDHIMTEMGIKNYVCEICGMKFLKQGYLNKHVRYHKLNNGEFKGFECEKCGKQFVERWRAGVHQRAVHKGGKYAFCKCDICGSLFAEQWMVRMHKHKEHGGEEVKEYQCEVCGKKFLEKWMIRSHQRSTHKKGVKKLYCELCGRNDHLAVDCSHRHSLQEVSCALCNDKFPSHYFLKEHVMSVHNFDNQEIKIEDNEPKTVTKNILYICAACGQQFQQKRDLKSHELNSGCVKNIKFECPECGKVFHSKASLSNHLMSHRKAEDETVHRCEFCNKTFVTAEALDGHMSPDKVCLFCGNVYPCSDQLKNHVYDQHYDNKSNRGNKRSKDELIVPESIKLETPTSGKPFECRSCGKAFARKQALQNHLFAEMNLRRFVCEFCDKSYNYYSHLQEHIITNHGEKEFVCGYCGKDFPTKKRFRDHVTLHSEDKPFLCECGLSFKLNRYLSKHKKRCKAGIKKE